MTQPNPFSLADSYTHLISPKIIGDGITGYDIAVDLVDIDTIYSRQLGGSTSTQQIQQAYIRQIGSTGLSGQAFFNTIGSSSSRGDAYFNNINWTSFTPPLPLGSGSGGATFLAGPGISIGPQTLNGITLSANIQGTSGIGITYSNTGPITISYNSPTFVGSTGIQVSYSSIPNTYTFSSTIGITGSTFIGVQQTGSTYTISYLGSQGVGGSLTGQTGPQGEVVFFTPGGLTSSSELVYTNKVLNVPEINIQTSTINGGELDLSTFEGDCYLQSGLFNPPSGQQGNFLYLSPFGVTAQSALAIDTQNYRVGINTDTPKTYLDVQGQTEITYDASFGDYPLLGGGTGTSGSLTVNPGSYTINAWGSGGASNAGIGGAGGASVTQITVGATGILSWGPQGGSIGGGPATQLAYNGSTFLWVPGGGAGGTGGKGGAAGFQGSPYPEGGDGGPGGIATLTDSQSWKYILGSTAGTSGGTFSSGSIGSVNAIGLSGTVITFNQVGTQTTVGAINTYTFTPGAIFTISNTSMEFPGTTFSSSSPSFFVNSISGINSGDGIGTTGIANGTALFDPFIPGSSTPGRILNANIMLNGSASVSTGNVTWMDGTYTSPSFSGGYTLILNGSFIDSGPSGNRVLTLTGPTQITFGTQLGTFNGIFVTDANVNVPPASQISVKQRTFINRGQPGSFQTSGSFGGGGFTGGGAPAKISGITGYTGSYNIPGNMFAGGGPGTWGVSGVSGISIGGNESYVGRGRFPYQNKFNSGLYGIGGTFGPGTSGYVAIENVSSAFTLPALIVNGNETISGGLKINGYLPNSGNDSINVSNDITALGALQSDRITVGSVTRSGGSILGNNGSNFFLPVNFPAGLSGAASSFSGPVSINSSGSPLTIGGSVYSFPPVGSIIMYGAASPPLGWLVCNGDPIPSQYTALISLIGANLPNLQSRVPIGLGQGLGLSPYSSMFGTGGLESVTLTTNEMPSHSHSVNDPGHDHSDGMSQGGGFAATDGSNGNRANPRRTGSSLTSITLSSTGGGNPHENRQPYLVVNFIIKY